MKHSIAAVSKMTSLTPDVIRAWERRYKIVEPQRDSSGVRLYSDDDAARLTLAGKATRLGHPIRRVAELSNERIHELLDVHSAGAHESASIVAPLIDAVRTNALAEASQILRKTAMLMPTREFVLDVIAPALREIGRQWENGDLTVWQEHFLSNEVINIAGTLQERSLAGASIVFATPPFERHAFGVTLASLLASARGVSVCNLGVTVPAAELVAATRQLRASAVVVGMTRDALPEREALDYLRELDGGLPASVALLIGGAGARLAAAAGPRARGIATLEEFDTLCQQWR